MVFVVFWKSDCFCFYAVALFWGWMVVVQFQAEKKNVRKKNKKKITENDTKSVFQLDLLAVRCKRCQKNDFMCELVEKDGVCSAFLLSKY